MRSGRTLWDELVVHYDTGIATVAEMRKAWAVMKPYVDQQRWSQETAFLAIQEKEAQWWRDACIAYFETFSHMPMPAGHAPPPHDLLDVLQQFRVGALADQQLPHLHHQE